MLSLPWLITDLKAASAWPITFCKFASDHLLTHANKECKIRLEKLIIWLKEHVETMVVSINTIRCEWELISMYRSACTRK